MCDESWLLSVSIPDVRLRRDGRRRAAARSLSKSFSDRPGPRRAGLVGGVLAVVLAALALTAIPARPERAEAAPPGDVQSLLNQLSAAAAGWGVKLTGISLEDLRGGRRWAVNGEQAMSFLSSAKLPWAVMAAATSGAGAVEPYAYPVFANSDNDAAGRLIDLAGGIERVNRYWYPTLGMTGSCDQRWNSGATREYSGQCGYAANPVFDLAHGHTFYNYNTADDMTTLLGRLWRGQVPGLDAGGRARVLEWSTWPVAAWAPDGDGTITGYLPPWTWPDVHHKIGWYFDPFLAASDIGIVDVPSTTYALAIAAYGGQSSAAQADFLSWASCEVYRTFSGDGGWNCSTRSYDAGPGRLDLDVAWAPAGTSTWRPIPSGRTSAVVTHATAIDVRVTVGPAGLGGDEVTVHSTAPGCDRTLAVTQPGAPLSYVCQLVVSGTTPSAQRWTAVASSDGATGASNSAGALLGATEPDYELSWQVQSAFGGAWSSTGPADVAAGTDPRWHLLVTNRTAGPLGLDASLSATGLVAVPCTDAAGSGVVHVDVAPGATREIICAGRLGAAAGALGGAATVTLAAPGAPARQLPPVSLGALGAVADAAGVPGAVPSGFVPAGPTRILDTRPAAGGSGPVPAGSSVVVAVPEGALPAGVPLAAIRAVAVNLTATEAVAAGYLTLHRADEAPPLASNVNVVPGEDAPDLGVITTDGAGRFAIAASTTTQVVVDLVGLFVDPAAVPGALRYHPVTPRRVHDTRTSGQGPLTPVGGTPATRTIPVRGAGLAVPSSALAVVVTATATGGAGPGWLAVHPEPAWPGTSNVNFATGDTRANTAMAPIGTDGAIRVTAGTATDAVIDVIGYFDAQPDGQWFVPLGNQRVADSRFSAVGPLQAGESRIAVVASASPTQPAAALISLPWPILGAWVTSTITEPTTPGFYLLWAGGWTPLPLASSQNVGPGQTRANGLPVAITPGTAPDGGPTASLAIHAGTVGPSQWVLDVAGVFVGST